MHGHARGEKMGIQEQARQDADEQRPIDAARFEEILTRLGSVVDKLEAGELPLEDSLLLFEEGVRLSRLGAARLDEAERRVERLLRGEDATPVLEARHKENEAP
jgi:exodeoxyribonuclease VII small subunit